MNHFVFTYDEVSKIKAIYQNGRRIAMAEGSDANDVNVPYLLWDAVGSFRIATRSNRLTMPSWGFWFGKLDDFRVYNYALTEPEIQWLATDGTGARNVPLIEPTNLSPSSPEMNNFNDYAIMMQNCLVQDLWP